MQFSRAHDVQRAIGFASTVAEKGVILMAGRKPKLTALKKLEGNPGKRQLNVKKPIPGKGIPDCPKWLFPEAKMEWERLCVKLSEMGVLTETDKGYQQQTPWVGIENTNQKLMMQAAAEFGLTPSACAGSWTGCFRPANLDKRDWQSSLSCHNPSCHHIRILI